MQLEFIHSCVLHKMNSLEHYESGRDYSIRDTEVKDAAPLLVQRWVLGGGGRGNSQLESRCVQGVPGRKSTVSDSDLTSNLVIKVGLRES